MLTGACCILHQHLMSTCLPSVKYPINPLSDLTGLGDVLGAVEVHCLVYNENLRIPAALPDSCEFCSQRFDKAAT